MSSNGKGITFDRETLEAWAGHSLTDEDVVRLDAAIHNSTVPDAIAEIAFSILPVEDDEDEPWCNHDAVAVVDGVCECGERV